MSAPEVHGALLFFSSYSHQLFRAGQVMIRVGETPAGIFYLVKGLVRQYTVSPKGETLMVHVFHPGSFFPMLWALTGTANTYQYEAVNSADVYRAPKNDVLDFLSGHPEELWRFTKRLAGGMSGLLTRFEYVVFDGAYRKIVLLLVYFARRFAAVEDGVTVISVPLAHREIAAWIGTTRETASVQMETLKKRGLIKTRGRQLIIPSLAALEREGDIG